MYQEVCTFLAATDADIPLLDAYGQQRKTREPRKRTRKRQRHDVLVSNDLGAEPMDSDRGMAVMDETAGLSPAREPGTEAVHSEAVTLPQEPIPDVALSSIDEVHEFPSAPNVPGIVNQPFLEADGQTASRTDAAATSVVGSESAALSAQRMNCGRPSKAMLAERRRSSRLASDNDAVDMATNDHAAV